MAPHSNWRLKMPERIGLIALSAIFAMICAYTACTDHRDYEAAVSKEATFAADSLAKADTVAAKSDSAKAKPVKSKPPRKRRQPYTRSHLDENI